jgi:hypothetical protein
MRMLILASFIAALCGVVAAQTSPPDVVFHGNCPNKSPSFQEWFQQTQLPYGDAYIAQAERKEQILRQYSKLKLQMPLEEVEKVLGKPDFSSVRPTARLATTPEPTEPRCNNELAYILKKSSENMADTEDVAIYLLFSEGGKLYWAAPQNLPSLKPLGSPVEGNASPLVQRQTASWKEYTFADDEFAITLPDATNPHPDAALPEMTVYTVPVSPDTKLSLRVSHQNRDCAATLSQLRDGALKGKSGIDPSSIIDVSIGGYSGLEYQYKLGANFLASDRFYCGNGRFYTFSIAWPSNQSRPTAAMRIVNSFRLLQ